MYVQRQSMYCTVSLCALYSVVVCTVLYSVVVCTVLYSVVVCTVQCRCVHYVCSAVCPVCTPSGVPGDCVSGTFCLPCCVYAVLWLFFLRSLC